MLNMIDNCVYYIFIVDNNMIDNINLILELGPLTQILGPQLQLWSPCSLASTQRLRRNNIIHLILNQKYFWFFHEFFFLS